MKETEENQFPHLVTDFSLKPNGKFEFYFDSLTCQVKNNVQFVNSQSKAFVVFRNNPQKFTPILNMFYVRFNFNGMRLQFVKKKRGCDYFLAHQL